MLLLTISRFIFFLQYLCVSNTISAVDPKFDFASYYGDHMVLQQGPKRANIWGYASNIGDKVTVQLDDQQAIVTNVVRGPFVDRGVWSVKLPPMPAGGPHTLKATVQDSTLTIKDVLFGDVWVCSGQSNMEFILPDVFNASKELEDAVNYQDIRLFAVNHSESGYQQFDFTSLEERWNLPNAITLGKFEPHFTVFSAVCWLYGKYIHQKLGYPIGLMESSWGGTLIESWSDEESLKQCGVQPPAKNKTYVGFPTVPEVLWNSMMHPLVNNTIYGAIWYQGEADSVPLGSPEQMNRYNCTFPAMINGWRRQFNQGSKGETSDNFPFGFVQLAPWENKSRVVGFPDIRWHQTADIGYIPNERLQNVFMAVAMDLPDYTSPYTGIHPRDKQDVAHRLALSGLAIAYNYTDRRYAGPFPTEYEIYIAEQTIKITYDQNMLDIRNKNGFEICCFENGKGNCTEPSSSWYTVPIVNHDDTSVTLSYVNKCTDSLLSYIRYEWRESPCPFKACAVYESIEQLPAPPFLENLLDTRRKIKIYQQDV